MADAAFVVSREIHVVDGHPCRWAQVTCPHGEDLGSIEVTEGEPFLRSPVSGGPARKPVWHLRDLGNGRCEVRPSLLIPGHHQGADCHFGPGEFPMAWEAP